MKSPVAQSIARRQFIALNVFPVAVMSVILTTPMEAQVLAPSVPPLSSPSLPARPAPVGPVPVRSTAEKVQNSTSGRTINEKELEKDFNQASVPKSYVGLNAVLWMQTSAEYQAAVRQAYAMATLQLEVALRERGRTAAVEQSGRFSHLPPAVIFDLDETVLNNMPYNARNVLDGTSYNDHTWSLWNQSGRVQPLPGAVAFAQRAARLGVRVFYISNRGAEEKADTIKIIHRWGLPIRSAADVMLKGEQPTWTSDKAIRRRIVTQHYRILLLLGDDLNDFVSARDLSLKQRNALQQRYAAYWGTRWILLPNPVYGSWESAVANTPNLTPAELLRREISVTVVPTRQP